MRAHILLTHGPPLFQSNMNAMTEHFSTVMLSGKGNAEQWKEMSVLNANGVETNKV